MQDEISLRDLILSIWKGKTIVAVITVVSVIVTIFINWFVLDPVYEAKSTIRISLVGIESNSELASLIETAKNDIYIMNMIEDLGLEEKYSITSVRNNLSIELSKDGTVMAFKARGKNPEESTKISNYMTLNIASRLGISDLSKKVISNTQTINALGNEIEALQEAVSATQQQLEQTPEFLVTKESLSNHPSLMSIVSESQQISALDAATLYLESQIPNPAYATLTETLSLNLIELNKKSALKASLEAENVSLQQQISSLEKISSNEFLTSKKAEVNLEGSNVIFLSPAIEPSTPVGPKKVLNVAMALAISLLGSIILVVLKDYLVGFKK